MRYFLLLALFATSGQASAADGFIADIKVTQIGTYQYSPGHFVWFSAAIPGCTTTMHFDETKPGGKALLATLTTALVGGRKVSVRYSDCDIIEVYLK
ncbi:hypothetical protein [Pseudoxanthomonas wuyuanensis]